LKNNQIKYLEGSFARASKHRADFLFLLRLKGAYSEGYIKDSLSEIGSAIGESKNTCKNRLDSLIKIGWVQRFNKGSKITYKLISYTKLYLELGYELKVKEKGWKGCYTTYKIPVEKVSSKKELELLIHGYDHSRRMQRMNLQRASSSSVSNKISCKGSAEIAGYKSSLKGWQIQKDLEKAGLLKINRSKTKINMGRLMHGYQYAKKRSNNEFIYGSTKFEHFKDKLGYIFRNSCNELSLVSLSPLLPDNIEIHQHKVLGF